MSADLTTTRPVLGTITDRPPRPGWRYLGHCVGECGRELWVRRARARVLLCPSCARQRVRRRRRRVEDYERGRGFADASA